jgi:hypothetical protein
MTQTQAIETVWFVYSEQGEPLGRLYMEEGAPAPEVGAAIPDGEGWTPAVITAVRELAPTCAMRRFRVTITQSKA